MINSVIVKANKRIKELFISMILEKEGLKADDIKVSAIIFLFNMLTLTMGPDTRSESEGRIYFTWTISKSILPYLQERFGDHPSFQFDIEEI